MMSLFAPFDLGLFKLTLYVSTVFFLVLLNPVFACSNNNFLLSNSIGALSKFFFSLKPVMFSKSFSLALCFSFFLVGILNLSSVWPYNFALMSQLSLVLFQAFISWVSVVSFQILNSGKNFLSHMVPEGTPIYLTWFLFIIEVISSMIRPITLTVRLAANILAGHLLMILLSKLALSQPWVSFSYALLNMVEVFVSLIQSYIFCTMICLYFSEVH